MAENKIKIKKKRKIFRQIDRQVNICSEVDLLYVYRTVAYINKYVSAPLRKIDLVKPNKPRKV